MAGRWVAEMAAWMVAHWAAQRVAKLDAQMAGWWGFHSVERSVILKVA